MTDEAELYCGHFRDEVRIGGCCVGVFSDFSYCSGLDWGIQIRWAINIPPTRFNASQRSQRETFSLLFAERHGARLLRASERCGGRYGLPRTRSHHKPHELGMCHFYYWHQTDDQDEQSRWAWILSRRGDRLEMLFEDNPEPVIVRKDQLPPGADGVEFWHWDHYDDGCRFHQSLAAEANERRSEIAKCRARNQDGTFLHDPTYKPVVKQRTTGIDVGALITEMKRLTK